MANTYKFVLPKVNTKTSFKIYVENNHLTAVVNYDK